MGLRELFSEDVSGVLDVSHELDKRCYCSKIIRDHIAGEHAGIAPIAQPVSPTSLDQGTGLADAGVAASSPKGTASVATQAASPSATSVNASVATQAASPPVTSVNASVATEVYPESVGGTGSPNPGPKKKSRIAQLMGGV
jgi:hypothetical protein